MSALDKRILGILLLVTALLSVGLLYLGGLSFVVVFGRYIPQQDLVWDYFLGVTWAGFLGLSIAFWPVSARDKRLLAIGWIARTVMTLGCMLIYEYYYDLDAFGYFQTSQNGFDPAGIIMGDGTRTIMTLFGLHYDIFPNSYHMLKVSCSMVGFVAVFLFYRAAVRFLKRDEPQLFYWIAIYPSILFWSSIVGKDPVMLLGVAIYVYAVVAWQDTFRFQFVALAALGIIETMYIRKWMGFILVAPLAVFVAYRFRGLFTRVVFVGIVVLTLMGTLGRGGDKFNMESTDDLVATAQRFRNSQSIGGSGRTIGTEFTDIGDIAAFAPFGMFTALFRPLPGEVRNPFGTLVGLENLFLLIIALRAARRFRLSELRVPLVTWAGALILLWSASYGFISYSNLGAAVRYKLQILPVLVLLLLYLNRARAKPVAAAAEPRGQGVAA